MRIPWSDNDTVYVCEIHSEYNCRITAFACTNDFFENNSRYKKMTYKEFKEYYPEGTCYTYMREKIKQRDYEGERNSR